MPCPSYARRAICSNRVARTAFQPMADLLFAIYKKRRAWYRQFAPSQLVAKYMGMPAFAGFSSPGLAPFRYRDFALFQLARLFIIVALEMQSVAIGWQIFATTKRALDLGLVGLAQFLPGILLFLLSGHVADRFDRRRVMVICYLGFALCSSLLFLIA